MALSNLQARLIFLIAWLPVVSCSMTLYSSAQESEVWIVERDMPQSRNLVPILNRSILVASGPGVPAKCTIRWQLKKINIEPGPFWPVFGGRAKMGAPVSVPENFPCREPRTLEKPQIIQKEQEALLQWAGIELADGEGAAVYADTYLGPADMYHTGSGLRFGDIEIETEYRGQTPGPGQVGLQCKITIRNKSDTPVDALDFSFFFPRALLDNKTGAGIPLIKDFAYAAEGFSDSRPLDLLISDGLARPAWGPRCVLKRDSLAPGESISCSLTVTGKLLEEVVLIVPLVSLVARTPARYWPSAQVEISPPGKVNYADYTHFNVVVADSRLFRLSSSGAAVEASSPVVLAALKR
ncbi:MAG: hypothetical protein KAW12_10660 [Candidatus Aminicenantes bacterium]|nr:hypothetical protein [Candidatus Aminicenantes bacterium]